MTKTQFKNLIDKSAEIPVKHPCYSPNDLTLMRDKHLLKKLRVRSHPEGATFFSTCHIFIIKGQTNNDSLAEVPPL